MIRHRITALGLALALSLGLAADSHPASAQAFQTGAAVSFFQEWTAVEEVRVADAYEPDTPILLNAGGKLRVKLNVPHDGEYWLAITYQAQEEIVLKSTMLVEIGDDSLRTQLFSLWQDSAGGYGTDRFGNELPPSQHTLDQPLTDYVKDQASVARRPAAFYLKKGSAALTLQSDDVPIALHSVRLVQAAEPPSYEEYRASAGSGEGQDFIVIEGESYTVKSDSYLRAGAERNPALYPYDYRVKKLNVLDSSSYRTAGQKVVYGFEVKTPGLYELSFRYSQNYKEDIPVYQNIEIDGMPLFAEMQSMAFPYTGSGFANITLSAGADTAKIHLEEGLHSLSIEADGTPLDPFIGRLREILSDISDIGLDIKKITGTSASEYRTWDVESYLPGVVGRLKGYKEELLSLYEGLGSLQKEEPAAGLQLKLAADNLEKVLAEPEKIPGKLTLLSEGSGSVTQFLSDQIDKLVGQNLAIDRIYLHNGAAELPPAEAGFFAGAADGCKRFFHSLFADDGKPSGGEETLTVWMNRPIHYVEILQAMADAQFTPDTGIRVELSVMPSEQRIILSNATDMAPDVVMGIGAGTPFDLGIRGAVMDLSQFEDFESAVLSEYSPESLVPYTLGDKIFGVSETQEFYVLMVRRDILDGLGLSIPETWEDVAGMMPSLRRNSMDFYLQLSGYTGTKPLYTTAPFLLQAGGSLYSEDGLSTAVNSKEALEGFETLTDLYRLYSVPQVVSSFYNSFRYGQIPLGIASFTDYVKIKNAAPEIVGKWEIALAPGIRDENGVIHRGTTGASTACAILEKSDKKEESWEFLKWWLSKEVQTGFGNTLQTTYGPDYLWNTANLKAFEELSFPAEDKAVILAQWEEMEEIPRHPALYAVERELSTAWINVVINGESPRIALDNAALSIDREFSRKLAEFGYVDRDGQKLRDFTHQSVEEILKGGAE